jgi:alpha-galactosidase
VIAIDQDPLGIQGRQVASDGAVQIWVKPLAGGDRAVALLNPSDAAVDVSTTATAIGLPLAPRYRLVNVWRDLVTETRGGISFKVIPDAAVLLRVSALY